MKMFCISDVTFSTPMNRHLLICPQPTKEEKKKKVLN